MARFAGAVAGVVVLLAPVSLLRNDLKQYTADAFFTLVVMALACRVEAQPGRRNLTLLVIGSAFSIVFSTATAFVVVAVFGGLAITVLATRSARRVIEVALAGGGTAVALVHTSRSLYSPPTIERCRELLARRLLARARAARVVGCVATPRPAHSCARDPRSAPRRLGRRRNDRPRGFRAPRGGARSSDSLGGDAYGWYRGPISVPRPAHLALPAHPVAHSRSDRFRRHRRRRGITLRECLPRC